MYKFVIKVIVALMAFTIFAAIFSVAIVRLLGNVVPRSILDGVAMGTIVVIAGTLGGWVSNEYKKHRQAKKE